MKKEITISFFLFCLFFIFCNFFYQGCGNYPGPTSLDSLEYTSPEVDSIYIERQLIIYDKLDNLRQDAGQQSQYNYWEVQQKLKEIDKLRQWMASLDIGDVIPEVQVNLELNTVICHVYAVKPGFFPRSFTEAGALREEVDLYFDQRPKIEKLGGEGYWFWLRPSLASTDRISSAVLSGSKVFYHFAILHEGTSSMRHLPYFLQEVVFSIVPAYLLEKYAREELEDPVLAEQALGYIKGWERESYEFLELYTQLNGDPNDVYVISKHVRKTLTKLYWDIDDPSRPYSLGFRLLVNSLKMADYDQLGWEYVMENYAYARHYAEAWSIIMEAIKKSSLLWVYRQLKESSWSDGTYYNCGDAFEDEGIAYLQNILGVTSPSLLIEDDPCLQNVEVPPGMGSLPPLVVIP